MALLVDRAMLDGALGLSSGLEYVVGSYASTDEVVALATAAARRRGVYISHIRDEADRTVEAVRETIEIGARARLPVQITHIKLGTVGVWGKAAEVVALVEAARRQGVDVMADAYPYLAWQSNLKVLVPNKQYTDPASVKEALDDVGGGKNTQCTRLARVPQYVGKRLSEAAQAEATSAKSDADRAAEPHTHRDGGVHEHRRFQRRYPRIYVYPGAARRCAADGLRLPRTVGSRTPDGRMGGRRARRRSEL